MAIGPGTSSGQVWTNATVWLAGGDSLAGQVHYADREISTSSVDFRKAPGMPITNLTTESAMRFKVSDPVRYFERLRTSINYYAVSPVPAQSSPLIETDSIHVFAEVILRGAGLTVYSMTDEYRDERVFFQKGEELFELINYTYLVEQDGRTYLVEKPVYKEQLKSLLSDCNIPVDRVGYTAKEITGAIRLYMECGRGSASFAQADASEILYLGAFGATGNTDIDNRKTDLAFWGIGLQLLSRRNFNNRFLWAEVGVVQIRGKSDLFYAAHYGTYLGHKDILPLVYIGLSSTALLLDAGVGLAYKKRLAASVRLQPLVQLDDFSNERFVTFNIGLYPRIKYR